jgi:hypothetical protein
METRLRYYIAPAAPPTRAPADGDEPFLRPEVGFNPSWFVRNVEGVDFSSRWHEDPAYRLECLEKMRAEIRRRFPGRSIGGVDEEGEPPDLLTGVYGGALVPALFGASVRFFPDKWPAPEGTPLSDAEADALEPADVENLPLFERLSEQLDRIERLTGSVRGFLNWQGVLNTAFRLRGEAIFLDLLEAPDRARHVFECVARTMIDGIRALHARQRRSGVDYRFATVSNCTVNMVGPDHYREFLLPRDLEIRRCFEGFGVHNCAWSVDLYLDAYAEIPDLGYIDMGITSDLARARTLFPDARRNVLYTSMDLADKSEEEIRRDFERIARDLAPCDVGLPDLECDVPDERILLAMDLCRRWSERRDDLPPHRGGASPGSGGSRTMR